MSFEMLDIDEAAEVFETKKRNYAGGPKGPRPRSEEQKPWDEAFDKAWKSEKKVLAVQVAPDKADEAAKHVASAARYFNLGVTEGVPKPGKVENTVILTWKIREVKPRKTAKSSAE